MRGRCLIVAAMVTFASSAGAVSTAYNVTLCPEVPAAAEFGPRTVVYADGLDSLSMPVNRSWIRGFTAGAENHCRVKQPGTGVVGAALPPEAPLLQLRLTGPYSPRFSTRSLGTRPLTGAAIFAGTRSARPYLNFDSSALIGGAVGIFLAVPEPAIR